MFAVKLQHHHHHQLALPDAVSQSDKGNILRSRPKISIEAA